LFRSRLTLEALNLVLTVAGLFSLLQNTWLYKLLGLEQQVNEWIAQLRTMSVETMKTKIREYANQYLQLEKTKWTSWDTQRGEYVFQVGSLESWKAKCLLFMLLTKTSYR